MNTPQASAEDMRSAGQVVATMYASCLPSCPSCPCLGRLCLVMGMAEELDVARVQIGTTVLPLYDVVSDDAVR